MEIYYDFELDEEATQPVDPNSVGLTAIRTFIKSKYSVLEDEIDKSQVGENIPFVVLCPMENRLGITKVNIPSHLAEKMDEYFTQADFEYLNDLLSRMRYEN